MWRSGRGEWRKGKWRETLLHVQEKEGLSYFLLEEICVYIYIYNAWLSYAVQQSDSQT